MGGERSHNLLSIFNFLAVSCMISCKDGFDFRGAEIAVSESIHHRLSNSQNESADPSLKGLWQL